MKTALCVSLMLVGIPALAAEPATVAILYFDYDGKDDELVTLRKGITQMLITDLAGREGYKVVERARLQDALAELDLASTRKIDPSSALRLGKLLQAKFVVAGGYFVMGGTLRLDARIYETETTKVIKGVGASGKSDDFFALEQKLAADVDAVLLGAAAKAAAEPAPKPRGRTALARSAKGVVPLKAVVLYAKGLDAIDAKEFAKAKQHLDEVVKANPDFLLARHDLSELAM